MGLWQVFSRIWYSVREYLLFRPAEYNVEAIVHVWTEKPEVTQELTADQDKSFTVTARRGVYVQVSMWILAIGAVIGGMSAFTARFLWDASKVGFKGVLGKRYMTAGLLFAVVISAVGTVLLQRLSGTDFVINLQVQDFWGSIASGFVIQAIGLQSVIKRLGLTENGSSAIKGAT